MTTRSVLLTAGGPVRAVLLAGAVVLAAAGFGACRPVLGQATPPPSGAPPAASALASAASTAPEGPQWSLEATAYLYMLVGDAPYLGPVVTADRGHLHLEARYNYEDPEAVSGWVGYNWETAGRIALTITPMAGIVAGADSGIAAGLKFDLSWRWLDVYTEAEWVYDLGDRAESFFYAWTELTLAPADWIQFGSVNQRTRMWDHDGFITPGILLRLLSDRAGVALHVFQPGSDNPTWVFGMNLSN